MIKIEVPSEFDLFKLRATQAIWKQWRGNDEDYQPLPDTIIIKTLDTDREVGVVRFSWLQGENAYYTRQVVLFYHSSGEVDKPTTYYLHHAMLEDDGDWVSFAFQE